MQQLPAVTTSQIRMEGDVAELVAGQQASTQTLLEVDKELEWLVAALGQQEPRDGIQAAMLRLAQQVQGLEGRGGTTNLQPGEENEFGTVAALQLRMEGDVAELQGVQRYIAEAVFEVYQEIAGLNLRLGKQDNQSPAEVAIQGPAQFVQYAPAQSGAFAALHSQAQRASEVRSMSWAPGATFVQQAAPAATSTYLPAAAASVSVPMPAQNLPTYGPPTTVVAPAQYMLPGSQPVVAMSAQAVPAAAWTGPVVTEAVHTYSAPPAPTQPTQPLSLVGSGASVSQSPALPAMPPTTVVAAPQYMLPGSQVLTADQQAMGGLTMRSLPHAVAATEHLQVPQPPALPPTTIVAPAQYMAGPAQATTPSVPAAMGSPVPVATQSMAAPVATLGAFVITPGTGAMASPGIAAGAFSAQTVPGVGALPMRGSLLKAGSITDDVFNMVDKDNDGVISRSEFRGALKGNVISATANTKFALQGHF